MRLLLRTIGLLVLLAALAAAVVAVQVLFFRPFDIGIFFEKIFLKAALDDPELLSQLRIVEPYGIRWHHDDLTDVSIAAGQERAATVRRNLEDLRRYERSELDDDERISYDILEWYLQDAVDGEPWMYHDYPVNPLDGVQSALPEFMVNIHQVNEGGDAQDYLVRLSKFPAKFAQVLEGLRLREAKGILPPRFVIDKVLDEMRALIAGPAQQNVLCTSFRAKLARRLKEPQPLKDQLVEDCARALEQSVYPAYRELIAYFESLQSKVSENYGVWKLPGGDEYYEYAARSQTTTRLDVESIHALGLAEVARIEGEMDAILRSQGLSAGTLGERMLALGEEARFNYPNDEQGRAQVIADFQQQIDEIDRGLAEHFDLRPAGKVRVERIPTFKEKTSPQAYYNPPAFDGSRPGTFYINLRDTREIKKFGMRTLAYHEAIPGHHFQISIQQQLTGVPTFRKVLGFTAYDEGWALYAERLAKEIGFQQDPFDDLGRLRDEMFRAVRLVVDTGLHRKRWSREQAIAYMIGKTGMPQADVVSEIERYMVDPGQALAYKVGMIRILELREKARQELGDRFDIREFHDVVLRNGSMPMGVLERVVGEWIVSRKS